MIDSSGRYGIEYMYMAAGSRWSNKRALDEDRPLGRGMRIKQEPAYIQDPAILTGPIGRQQCTAAVVAIVCFDTVVRDKR